MMTVPNFYKLETSEWNLNKYNDLIVTRRSTIPTAASSFLACRGSASR